MKPQLAATLTALLLNAASMATAYAEPRFGLSGWFGAGSGTYAMAPALFYHSGNGSFADTTGTLASLGAMVSLRLSNLRAGLLIDTGGIGPATTVHYAVVAGPVFTFDAPISLELLAEVGGTEFSRMGDEHASVPGMMPSVGLRTFLALRYGADDEGSIGIFMSVREELTRANVELQQYNNFHEANGQVDIYRMGGRSIEFGLQFGWDFRLQQD